MKLAPKQTQAVRDIVEARKPEAALKKSKAEFASFKSKAKAFAKSSIAISRGRWYAIVLSPSKAGTNGVLDEKKLLAYFGAATCVIWVDQNLQVLKAEATEVNPATISQLTLKHRTFAFLVSADQCLSYLQGITTESRSLVGRAALPLLNIHSRTVSELFEALKDHWEHAVDREQQLSYWADKSKRVLHCGIHGTEFIFQQSLINWLRTNVSDYILVFAEPDAKLNPDKTDIVVVAQSGSYVIEVKWLGKNLKNTAYAQKRINEGLYQVKLYLDHAPQFIEGFLTVYDGRNHEDHLKKSGFNKTNLHKRCRPPRIFFLDSSSPSLLATQEAAQ